MGLREGGLCTSGRRQMLDKAWDGERKSNHSNVPGPRIKSKTSLFFFLKAHNLWAPQANLEMT